MYSCINLYIYIYTAQSLFSHIPSQFNLHSMYQNITCHISIYLNHIYICICLFIFHLSWHDNFEHIYISHESMHEMTIIMNSFFSCTLSHLVSILRLPWFLFDLPWPSGITVSRKLHGTRSPPPHTDPSGPTIRSVTPLPV
jgi:hypothetical protein